MPRPPTAHRHPHSNARQFDLFCDPPYAAAQTPPHNADACEHRRTIMFSNQQKRLHRGLPFVGVVLPWAI